MRRAATALLPLVAALAGAPSVFAQGRSRIDLSVTAVLTPAEAVAGQETTLRAELVNSGTEAARFDWAAVLTLDGIVAGAPELARWSASLDPGERRTVNVRVPLPADASGRHRIAAVVDPDGAVAESNEYDNVALAAAHLRIRRPAADVGVVSVEPESLRGRPGEPLAVGFRVANRGELATSVEVSVRLTSNETGSIDDVELGRATVALEAGASEPGRVAGVLPPLPAGDYAVVAIVDPDQQLAEVAEQNNVGAAARSFNVFHDGLAITTPSLPNGTVFIDYHVRLAAAGGDGRYRWAVTGGRLPTGLALDSAGVLSGTVLESGRHPVQISVISAGLEATAELSIDVSVSGLDLEILTPSVGRGTVGLPFTAGLTAGGGEPPYVWRIVEGAFPPGLDVSPGGWISGVPTQAGSYGVIVMVTDGVGSRDTREFQLDVEPATVQVQSDRLAPLPLGGEVDITLTAAGGLAPHSWRAKSRPPPGLTVTEDGHLVGTPTEVGTFTVRVQATDASEAGASDTALLHVTVEDAGTFDVLTTELRPVQIRERTDFVLQAAGGTPPLRWRLTPGDRLPPGFELVESETAPGYEAVIRGSSLRPLAHGFGVQVEDAAGRSREVVLALHVLRPEGELSEGCACAVPSRSGAPGALLGLAFLGLGLALRRRR